MKHYFFVPSLLAAPLALATLAIGQPQPALAQVTLQCSAPSQLGPQLQNQAQARHTTAYRQRNRLRAELPQEFVSQTGLLQSQIINTGSLRLEPAGVLDGNGQSLFGLGQTVDNLAQLLMQQGWSESEAWSGAEIAVQSWLRLSADAPLTDVIAVINNALAAKRSANLDDLAIALAVTGMSQPALQNMGLSPSSSAAASTAAAQVLAQSLQRNYGQALQAAVDGVSPALATEAAKVQSAVQGLQRDYDRAKAGQAPAVQVGETVYFRFELYNPGSAPVIVQVPSVDSLQQSGLLGGATVRSVQLGEQTTGAVEIPARQRRTLLAGVQLSAVPTVAARLEMSFGGGCGGQFQTQHWIVVPSILDRGGLDDPSGRISGCSGNLLADYRGFKVGLYLPADATGTLGPVANLTPTEQPDIPGNNIPSGINPNRQNSNPFFLTNADQGGYSFLLDPSRGQLDPGDTYILLVSPPADSTYSERRIRIVIGDRNGTVIPYTATALDGGSISSTAGSSSVNGTITIGDANQVGLVLAVFDLATDVCDDQSIQIVKTADRAAAEPGDTVIYRLSVRNLATAPLRQLAVTDVLPLGFQFVASSPRSALGQNPVPIEADQQGNTITFRSAAALAQGEVLTIAYAAQLTPDALRGNGTNTAIANAERSDNGWDVRDGPALHRLRIQPGIVADCGTILGRVFEDRNFDGEQQSDEPGIANAVIFMDDGNRITTDEAGLYSVANVLPGYRTGALDLTSVPGYALAPNQNFIEPNSPSRLVQLAPGGMVRMNFAVTPIEKPTEQPTERPTNEVNP